jgi:hypothetical protein
MSGSDGIISFDLKHGHGSIIDLASMFPLTKLHPLDHNSWENILDDMQIARRKLDFSVGMQLSVNRFRTLETLDLATQKLRVATPNRLWKPHTRLKSCLTIIDPIYIPYASIDIRRYQKRTANIRYADIFVRSLPYKIMLRRTVKTTRHTLYRNRRAIIFSLWLFFVCSFPLLYFIKMQITQGYTELLSLSKAKDTIEMRDHILSSRWDFERARVVFLPFSWIPLDTIRLANRALNGWLAVTRALDTIARTLPTDTGSLMAIPKSRNLTPDYRWSAQDIFTLSYLGIDSPTKWIRDNKDTLHRVQDYLAEAWKIYASANPWDLYFDIFENIGWVLNTASTSLGWYLDNDENILSLLGDDAPKRYLVLNQNRDEIRANGWFPWTVITFTLYKWNVLDYRKDDVYYFDWNLYPYKEIPPPGIALLTNNYGLRDVNYYPDFRKTLEKANSFIERSGDSTLTTGIAIHQWLIEDILRKVGPVTVSWVTIPFTWDNFSLLMSTLVEANYGRENHAKDILFSFIDAFTRKIHEKKSYMMVIESIRDYWNNGEILIASRDQATDDFLSKYKKKLPWECDQSLAYESPIVSGDTTINQKMPNQCSRNWIYPVFTSVSWNKSDRYIDRTYRSTVTKILGCKYENLITITNTHTFSQKENETILQYLDEAWVSSKEDREKYRFIQWNGKNKAFVRLFVPLWSELALGWKDIQSESNENATVFSFMLEAPVGGSASKTIRYTTNIPNCQTYNSEVDWYRQPWLRKVVEK